MTINNAFPVDIAGAIFPPHRQLKDERQFQAALSRAHLQDQVLCRCTPNQPVKLIVKRYGADTENEFYGLAKWPETGLDHHPDCKFFGDDESEGSDSENKPAYVELPDGKHRVHLAAAMKIIERNVKAIASGKPTPANKTTQQRASQISLLMRLWRAAGLNVYRGTKCDWYKSTFRILKAADTFIINKVGEPLSQYLLIGATRGDTLAIEHNQRVLDAAKKAYTRLFVLARLKVHGRDKNQFVLPLRDFNGLPYISIKLDQLDEFLQSRQFFRNVLANDSGNIVVLAQIEPGSKEWWSAMNITGICTSTNFIPVESSFEIAFDDYLVSENRKFLKPIALNEVTDDGNRPDYILLDTSPRVFCEVWGMNTDEYLTGKAKRIEKYRLRNQSLISWDAYSNAPLPLLPLPS